MKNKRIHTTLAILIYMLSAMVLPAVYCICIIRPENNLLPKPIIIGVFFIVIIAIVLGMIIQRGRKVLFAHNKVILILLPILYGIFLFIFDYCNRTVLQNDSGNVWNAAFKMCNYNDASDWWYFIYYSNNFKPMLILLALMRFASIVGISQLGFALFVNVAAVVVSIWCVAYLVSRYNVLFALLAELFLMLCLPILAQTQGFYTDSLSFCPGIAAIAIIVFASNKSSNKKYFLLAFAGILFGIGISIKVTVAIILIAFIIASLLKYGGLKIWKEILTIFLPIIIVCTVFELYALSYDEYAMSKEYGEPFIDFIATGLKGNGGFLTTKNIDIRYYL